MKNLNVLKHVLLIVGLFISLVSYGQDPRVSQFQAIPMLVNPAQTGDFEGQLRILGLAARINSRFSHNYFYNASLDYNLGGKNKWGLGLNYMQSGTNGFPISGRYYSGSLSRNFILDGADLQELRVGGQISYLTGKIDVTDGEYDRLLDVSAFRYLNRQFSNDQNTAKADYLNFSVGAKYKLEVGRLKIETGIAAYNITNPNYNFPYPTNNTLLKRYRVTALSTIYYQFSKKDAFLLEHYSWKEGIFLREYKPIRDTVEIHETTYGLKWLHKVSKNTLALGLYARSWKSAYATLGVNFSDRLGLTASYETPILKPYYDIAHVELGLSFYPFRKKATVKKTPEQLNKQVMELLPFGSTPCVPCDSAKIIYLKPTEPKDTIKVIKDTLAPEKKPELPIIIQPLSKNGNEFIFKDTVYYNLDKYNIRPDAQLKLDNIGKLMTKLDLTLDVRSHTDLRANAAYNQKLSENRSNAVKTYLMGAGVKADKISISWYGKKQPINDCINCSDSLQQKNRRSELILKGFNEDNLQLILKNKLLGADVKTKAELEAKIKALVALDYKADTPLHKIDNNSTKYFTIQIGAFKTLNPDNNQDLKKLNMFSQPGVDGYRRYFYGVFANRAAANKQLLKLQQIGFKDAFVRELNLSLKPNN